MRAALLPRVQGELLDFRAANRSVQVVVQPVTARDAEEARRQAFELAGTQRFAAPAVLVTAVEQAIDVLLDVTLSTAHRFRVAEKKQNTGPRLEFAPGNGVNQRIEQLDRRSFIAMDAG